MNWRIALLLVPLLFSCSGQGEKKSTDKLRINFFSEPATLDPRTASYSIYTNIFPMLYDGLTRFGPDGKLSLSVAKEVEVSDDGRKYTFHLKPTYWSNGDPVTAAHFADAWTWSINPKNPAPLVNHLYVIKNGKEVAEGKRPIEDFGVYAKDSETLVVELEDPLPYFLDLVSMYNFFPVHPTEGVYNGPFVLKKWKAHQEMVLAKNQRYWESDVVSIREIHIQFIQDTHTELKLFEQGELDWAGAPLSLGPPVDALPSLKEERKLEADPFLSTYFYSFNLKKAPFHNKKIRKALSMAIPRFEICEHVTQGGERPAFDFIPDLIKNDRDVPLFGDQELRDLFREGLREEGLTAALMKPILLSYNVSETHHKVAQAVQDRWRSLFGIEVKLKSSDWKAHLSEIKAENFEIARMQWKGLSADPVNYIEIFSNPSHPMHNTSWNNGRFLSLYKQALTTTDGKKRLSLISEMEKEMREDVPIIPVFFGTMPYVKNSQLTGVVMTPIGAIDFKWSKFL